MNSANVIDYVKVGNEEPKDVNPTNNQTDPDFDRHLEDFIYSEDNSKATYVGYFLKFTGAFSRKFLPVSIVYLIYMLINLMNIIFVSRSEASKTHENRDLLYGVNLGIALYYMLGISTSFGLNSALDTFCTNSYGAKLYYLMGCYLNRALVILTFLYIPTSFLMFFLRDALEGLGQEEHVALHAGNVVNGMLPGMIFFFWTDALRRFIQAQGVYTPTIFIVLLTSLIHPAWLYIFFHYYEMGATGIGLATTVTNILNFFLMLLLVRKYAVKDSWFFVNQDAFKGWTEFFTLAIPSMLMMCLETWNYQIVNFLVGYLKKTTEQNVNSYLVSFSSLVMMFPFGLSVAASNVIGRLVGDFSVKKTEVATKTIIVFCFVFSCITCVFLAVFKNAVPYIYTDDEDEVELMQNVLWIYVIYAFFEILTNSYAGIYRGMGMQRIISFAIFIAYYIICLPLTYFLTFYFDLRVYGVWSSYAVSILFLVLLYALIHHRRVDYYRLCKEANSRMSRDSLLIAANEKENSSVLDGSASGEEAFDIRRISDPNPLE